MKDILDNNLFSNEQSNSQEEKNDQFDKQTNPTFEFDIEPTT